MKLKNRAVKACACALCAVIISAVGLVSACSGKDSGNVYKIPELNLPTAEQYALKKYDYDSLSDVQTTVRADTMTVLERGLPRAQTSVLSDDFSIIYDTEKKVLTTEYGELVKTSGNRKTATISFDRYPAPSASCDGTGAFSNGTMNGQAVASDNKDFYKYMLMSQGQHLAVEAAQRSANGTLTQEWLKKHPYADEQYGAVLGENNAVKKEIILDPIYRSYHTTGLYLPAGEVVKIKVEGLKSGEKISVILGVQDSLAWAGSANDAAFNAIAGSVGSVTASTVHQFFTKADVLTANGQFGGNVANHSQWNRQNGRLPWLRAEFTFTENKEYSFGTPFGGVIEIGMNNCYSRVKTTITGAVETPHYILGQTKPEYFDEFLRDAPGVIAVLDTENGQLIGPTGEMGTTRYMRQVKKDEIDKLANLWHSFLSVNESFTGGVYNRFNKIMFDWHVPAGAAVALGNYSFAQPTGWFNDAMNYRGLLSRGTWGTLHEIGHNHGAAYGSIWGFGCGQEGEVRNNALTLLAYIMLCDVGTTVRNVGTPEHGEYANPYSTLTETINKKGKYADANNCGYFEILGMYANIMHSFGAEKFYELLYTYKNNPSYSSNKRADFAYRCSLVYAMNFKKYFNDFYAAGISDDMFTAEQLAEMSALPNYEPVSCFYAGGIDGVKTAGDYIVTFGEDVTFDLLGKTVSTLDSGDLKGFEIIKVNSPEHGKISAVGGGKWVYSFDTKYTGTFDTFTFDVKLSDGTVHSLEVTLRISYNGGRVSVYNDVQGANIDEVLTNISGRQPDEIIGTSDGSIKNYQTENGKKDVRISEFYWKAPKSGQISISGKWDDWAKIYMGDSFDSLEEALSSNSYTNGYKDYGVTRTVEEGKRYAVRIVNVNTGGGGSASFAYKYGEDAYAAAASTEIFHPLFPLGKDAPMYVYEPNFLVSKKDNIKLSLTGTDKSQWKVVKAPENIVGGRFLIEQQTDPETGKPIEGSIMEIDKWSYLIDGFANTVMHTTYGAADKQITSENPHEFIVDTAAVQTFNYFTVTTRNNVNSYITDFELQISDTLNGNWKTIATGDRNSYSGTSITLKFSGVSGRYFRLLVKGTTGGNFSVLAEIDAGIQSETQKVVPPTSNKIYATKGWKNSSLLADEPSGFLIANKSKQKLVIKFRGESIALYGATGSGYGSADVYLDGKKAGSFNLDSENPDSRHLVFNSDNLKNKEHTVEIITTSNEKVMLSIIGLPYMADLINAPNIYKENALAISLTVFVVLFAAATAVIAVLVFVPKFRNKVFGNRFIKKLDARTQKNVNAEEQEEIEPVEQTPAKKKGASKKKSARSKTEKSEK